MPTAQKWVIICVLSSASSCVTCYSSMMVALTFPTSEPLSESVDPTSPAKSST